VWILPGTAVAEKDAAEHLLQNAFAAAEFWCCGNLLLRNFD
jgi:hypothetical protein